MRRRPTRSKECHRGTPLLRRHRFSLRIVGHEIFRTAVAILLVASLTVSADIHYLRIQ